MSYTLKYRYSFKSLDDNDCRVDIFIKDAPSGLKILNPGARPFVLREFNGDKDFFKPVRGFIAELEILSDNVSMDEFLSNEDDGVQVRFYFNNVNFWTGWLMQDDFEENWIDTYHYITLRATDGLGTIGSQPMTQVIGQQSLNGFLAICLEETPLQFFNYRTVNNLFYNGMDDRSDGEYNPLDQITVDGKTFEGDTKDKVLDKILRAWNLSVYQYFSQWYVGRTEEWLTNNIIQGLEKEFTFPYNSFSDDYEVNIGVGELVKPVMPEMLRSIKRPAKRNKISFFYRFPNQIICNQDYQSGEFIENQAGSGVPEDPPKKKTRKIYEVDCWEFYKGRPNNNLGTPSAEFYRADDINDQDEVTESYLEITYNATPHFIESTPFSIGLADKLKYNFEYRFWNIGLTGNLEFYPGHVVKLVGASSTYYLTADLTWSTTYEELNVDFIPTENTGEWTEDSNTDGLMVTSPTPVSGEITFYFLHTMPINPAVWNIRNIEVEIEETDKKPGIVGDYDQYELAETINQNYEEEIFLDDADNRQHKGALNFEGDVTGDNWYRMDFPSERLTFKRHKAIAHMFLNKRFRQRLQVSMFGLTWDDGKPIWLQNKFVFVDDAPTKKFMIVNLSEMDFSSATWKADLIEVWDDDLDDNDPDEYPVHTFANIYKKDV